MQFIAQPWFLFLLVAVAVGAVVLLVYTLLTERKRNKEALTGLERSSKLTIAQWRLKVINRSAEIGELREQFAKLEDIAEGFKQTIAVYDAEAKKIEEFRQVALEVKRIAGGLSGMLHLPTKQWEPRREDVAAEAKRLRAHAHSLTKIGYALGVDRLP